MSLQPPAPSPVIAFQKGLIHWAEDTFIDPFTEFYDWISAVVSKEDTEWRLCALVFSRTTPAGTNEDNAQFGLNITNITGGDLDRTWTATDYTDCETAIMEFWNALSPQISNTHTLKELRWYVRRFNTNLPVGQPVTTLDPATGKPYARFENTGPPARVHPVALTGGNPGVVMPYQNAVSITFKTPTPKHWGRIYFPGMAATVMDTGFNSGRLTTSAVSSMANQMAELVDDLAQKHFQLVVPTTQVDGKFHVALQQVNQIQVDDIPDVVRRRRPKQARLHTIGAPLP
jgi:hypothetical protein